MGRRSACNSPRMVTGPLDSALRPTMSPLLPVHVTTSIVVCVEYLLPLGCFLRRPDGKDHRAIKAVAVSAPVLIARDCANPCRGSSEVCGGSGSERTLASASTCNGQRLSAGSRL